GLEHGNPVIEVESRRPTDRRGLGHGSVEGAASGPMMRAKAPMKVTRELENTLLGKISSGDYLKEAWFTECGVPLKPHEVRLSKFADSDVLDRVVYHRTNAAWEREEGRVEVPRPKEDDNALEEIRRVVGLVEVPLGESILEINPASSTESVVECERVMRCELGTSTSSRLPDRHKEVVALLPSEATSETIDTILIARVPIQ
ncbi:FtsJ methyltransferase domain containing 1, partial [Perkinsus olseni]